MASGVKARRVLARSVVGLAGVGCAACCVLPGMLVAGVVGGAGWAAFGRLLPGIALGLVGVAGLAWWWAGRHTARCPADCTCRSDATPANPAVTIRRGDLDEVERI